MTNYNDGNWHGWNGGDCPVHPSTFVEVTWPYGGKWTGEACLNVWNVVQLFRVVEKHKEPQEFWIVDGHVFDEEPDSHYRLKSQGHTVIHVREVIEE